MRRPRPSAISCKITDAVCDYNRQQLERYKSGEIKYDDYLRLAFPVAWHDIVNTAVYAAYDEAKDED